MFGYIYKTTEKQTGSIYIGQHHGSFDSKYIGSGAKIKNKNKDLFVVEFLCEALDQQDLDSKEIEQIRIFRQEKQLLNIMPGGRGIKPEVMLLIRSSLAGKPKSKEHIKKLKEIGASPKFKERMSKLHKGKIIPIERRIAHSEFMTGRKASEETRAKMRLAQSKRPKPSEETKQKLRDTWARRKLLGQYKPKIKNKDILCA